MPRPLRALSLEELRTRTSLKWRLHPDDVLPLWVAEMDTPLAEPIVHAVEDALARGDLGYAWGTEYPQALAAFARDRWSWDPPIERIRMVPDVMQGAMELLRLVTRPGEAVVVNPPVYPPFYGFLRRLGRDVVEVPLDGDDRLDLDLLAEFLSRPEVTGYLLCSPHNPTGTVHTADELRTLAELADGHGVRVVADEIHAPVTLPGTRFVPFLSLSEAQRGFALLSGSKGWNLAGIKAALAVAGSDAGGDLERMGEEVGHAVNHLGAVAHAAAFRSGAAWLDLLLADLVENQRLFSELLREHLPAVTYRPAAATYLAWLDCRDLGFGADPAKVFLDRGRVALTGGIDFGPGGEGRVRCNLATTPEILTEAVRRIASAVRA